MRKLKRYLAGLMASVMVAGSMTVPTFAEIKTTDVASIDGVGYATLQEAFTNVKDGEEISLLSNAEVNETIVISDGNNITLSLNAHDVKFALDKSIVVQHGGLNITGTGKLYEEYPDYAPVRLFGSTDENALDYSTLTVGEDVTLEGWAGIFIPAPSKGGNNYGVAVDFSGHIISKKDQSTVPMTGSGIYVNGVNKIPAENCPKITVGNAATIESEGLGLYLAGYADTQISGNAGISGEESGIEIRAGKLTISGTPIIEGKATETTVVPNGNGSTTVGAGLAIAQHTTGLPIDVVIEGGEFIGHTPLNESNPQKNAEEVIGKVSLTVTGGQFSTANGGTKVISSESKKKFVSGGVFDKAVDTEYIADGYMCKLGSGAYEVSPLMYEVKVSALEDNEPNDELVNGNTICEPGTEVTVTALKNNGYAFEGWYRVESGQPDQLVSKELEYTFTPTSDIALVAKYSSGDVELVDIKMEKSRFKMGEEMQFSIVATASNATASNADYSWEFVEWPVDSQSGNSIIQKAVVAGISTVKAAFTDDDGNAYRGIATFEVEAPTFEAITEPENIILGEPFKLKVDVGNIIGSAEELGISNFLYNANSYSENVFNITFDEDLNDLFVAIDYPQNSEDEVISGWMVYPVYNEEGIAVCDVPLEKRIAVNKPEIPIPELKMVIGETTTGKIVLDDVIQKLSEYWTEVQIEVPESDPITYTYDKENFTVNITLKETATAGTAHVKVLLPSGAELVSYPVVITAKDEPVVPEEKSITLDKTFLTLYTGETHQLEATTVPAGEKVTWTSNRPEYVSVTENGLVTALRTSGIVTITASLESGEKEECQVRVRPSGVYFEPEVDTIPLTVGEKTSLKAVTRPEGKAVTWTSDNEKIATGDANGVVTAIAKGTAVITAECKELGKLARTTITVMEKGTTVAVENGKVEVPFEATDMKTPSLDSIKLPEGAAPMTQEDLDRKTYDTAEIMKEEIAFNSAVTSAPATGLLDAVKVSDDLEDGHKAIVFTKAQLTDMEVEAVVAGEGAEAKIQILPKKLVYDAKAYMNVYDENGVLKEADKVIPNTKLNGKNITFRLAIPSSVTKKYAKVEHSSEGYSTRTFYCDIKNPGTENAYIDVTVNHFSQFVLTFENTKPSTGTGSGSGSGGGGIRSYTAKDVKTELTGSWVQDARGWWFRYSDGTWPAAKWVELEWNGVRSWYSFNAEGYMENGWKLENGLWYYLHPYADGTQGYMYTGWHEIGGKWYYFSTMAGGPLGSMAANTMTPDGYQVGTDGAWIQ